jgi:hypothetical protein
MIKLSNKELKKLEEKGKLRDGFEIWIDKHNHKFELVRTFTAVMNVILSSVIMLRVFGVI